MNAPRPNQHRIKCSIALRDGMLLATLGLVVLGLAACVVGPDYRAPTSAQESGYTHTEVVLPSAGTVDAQQRLALGHSLTAQWWQLFRSRELDQTLSIALSGSPTLDAARATLAQAEQAVTAARGAYLPQVDVVASANRDRTAVGLMSTSPSTPVSTLYSIGPVVSYGPDLFGRTRRLVEQQMALAEFQRHELNAAYLTVAGNVVTQALAIASARDQIRAAEEIISIDRNNLDLVQIQLEAGKVAQIDALSAQTQLAADQVLMPPLRQQLALARHALALLAGKTPGEWSPPDFDLASLSLPLELPVTIPSDLVRSRPDILAAESQLHAANAAIGVATANLYPNLSISAAWERQAGTAGGLFNSAVTTSSIVASLIAPIFHGGALEAQRQASIDAFTAQLAIYRQTVLQAFAQVADVLRALQHDAELLAAAQNALDLAQSSMNLNQESYVGGHASLLEVLNAQRLYQQARLAYVRARAQRYQDTAQLFEAMGGGWESGSDAAKPRESTGTP
jgi:NodT family efflux transporter outer membrane factor (OMF) lipoprotein